MCGEARGGVLDTGVWTRAVKAGKVSHLQTVCLDVLGLEGLAFHPGVPTSVS